MLVGLLIVFEDDRFLFLFSIVFENDPLVLNFKKTIVFLKRFVTVFYTIVFWNDSFWKNDRFITKRSFFKNRKALTSLNVSHPYPVRFPIFPNALNSNNFVTLLTVNQCLLHEHLQVNLCWLCLFRTRIIIWYFILCSLFFSQN